MKNLLVWILLWPVQDRESLDRDLRELEKKSSDPDVLVFAKGAAWALRYEAALAPRDATLVRKSRA